LAEAVASGAASREDSDQGQDDGSDKGILQTEWMQQIIQYILDYGYDERIDKTIMKAAFQDSIQTGFKNFSSKYNINLRELGPWSNAYQAQKPNKVVELTEMLAAEKREHERLASKVLSNSPPAIEVKSRSPFVSQAQLSAVQMQSLASLTRSLSKQSGSTSPIAQSQATFQPLVGSTSFPRPALLL